MVVFKRSRCIRYGRVFDQTLLKSLLKNKKDLSKSQYKFINKNRQQGPMAPWNEDNR